MAYFLQFGLAKLGSVGDHFHNLSGGVELGPFQDLLATKHSIAATEVRLCVGHEAPRILRP